MFLGWICCQFVYCFWNGDGDWGGVSSGPLPRAQRAPEPVGFLAPFL